MIYAAYGSNLNHAQMAVRCPAARYIGRGILKNYELVFRRHADIQPCNGGVVPVGLWKLTRKCLAALDLYEGMPVHYSRSVTDIVLPNRRTVRALIYFMNYDGYEAPSNAYYNCIAEGYEDCNLPKHRLQAALEITRQRVEADELEQELAQQSFTRLCA